jgi:two-component system, OmpR family, sensor histidine kinase KdpD
MQRRRDALESGVTGVLAGAFAVAVITAAIALIDNWVPVLSLGVLYVFAVLPVAVIWGVTYAVAVGVASMLAFNFFFLAPIHTLTLSDSRNWFALAVYLATGIVVGTLASRARRRRAEAEQRERESALLANVAADLLRGTALRDELERVEQGIVDVFGVSSARIALGEREESVAPSNALALSVDGRPVGALYIPESEQPSPSVVRRLLPALASLLGVAREREGLEREALEAEALRRSDTMKTAIIQAVSHDLRTPLATIEQALDGLESDVLVLSDQDRAELMDTIRLEHSRLKRLVENLLDLSRLQAGPTGASPELWTADELLSHAVAEVGSPDRVVVAETAEVPPVRVDAVQVERILVNLLENALRVSPRGEPVHVRVSSTASELLIRVTDHGPGVPEPERERIFEPFHRIDRGSTERGAGLGLAIARGFAEANGGRLWLESRAGQGASFVLEFPAAELPVRIPA